MDNIFKIAMLQLNSNNSIEKNIQKGETFCRKAKNMGADLIVFPEMWSNGYESLFEGNYLDNKDIITQEQIESYYSKAVDINSNFMQKFIELAKELKIAIAITFLEKNDDSKKPKNTVCIIDRKGNIILKYSKIHTVDFKTEHFLEPGKEFYTTELEYKNGKVKLGAMICYDREFPESARMLMLQGSEIVVCPNACYMSKIRLDQLKVRAYENMCGIVTVNYADMGGKSSAFSPIVRDKNKQELDNELLIMDEQEAIGLVEFDLNAVREYRSREIWGNAYRKPAAYKKIIDSDVQNPFIRFDSTNN